MKNEEELRGMLEGMDFGDLETLQQIVGEKIAELREKAGKLIVYTHDCKDASSYHLGKYKHWAKLVTSVDTTKTNGYAFQGKFLDVQSEHLVPVGSVIVEVCGKNITAYQAVEDGFEEIAEARTDAMVGFINKVAAVVNSGGQKRDAKKAQ